MLISVVIPVYFRTAWLEKCFSALSAQDKPNNFEMEVMVVDDGSPNGEEIEKIVGKFKNRLKINYLYQDKRGPAAAKNLGINRSKGEIVCFIDDDSICSKDWVSQILKEFSRDASIGIVNGKLLSYYRDDNSLAFLLEQSVYKPRKSWATCNIAYRRGVFESVGLFDERYRLASWEDNDFGFRASWLGGIKHVYCPEAVIYHAHEQTFDEFREKGLRSGSGLGVFFRKFFLTHPALAVGVVLIIIKDIYLIFHPNVFMRRKETKEFLRFMWSVYSLKGYLKGFFRWK